MSPVAEQRNLTAFNSPVKTLIADDEAEVRAMMAEYLAMHGFEVHEAADGLEALLQVKRIRPQVVLIDLRMPRLGGLDALKRIRAFDAAILVVVVTADADPELHRQALTLGARAVLLKPVAMSKLLAAVRGAERSVPEPTARSAVRAETPPREALATSPGRVLVVDDDPEIRALLEEFLTLHGYQTRSAEDGATALREIIQAAPDAVLLDVTMPGLLGVEALPSIRAVAPHTAVIMVSGIDDVEIAKRTLALGAFDFVVKPADLAYLAQSLETALLMNALEM